MWEAIGIGFQLPDRRTIHSRCLFWTHEGAFLWRVSNPGCFLCRRQAFRFLAGLDIVPETGAVYFTEASSTYQIRYLHTLLGGGDKSGSLVKFNSRTMETSVLLRDLAVPSGVAVSKDGSYVLLPGRPDNIKRNSAGEFCVAFNNPVGSPPLSRPLVLPLAMRVDGNGYALQEMALVEEYGTESLKW